MRQKLFKVIVLVLIVFIFFSFQDLDQEDSIISESERLIKEGNYSKAISLLLAELNKNNKSYKIPERIAYILFSQQVYDLALKYYLLAYKNGFKDVTILEKIGECYAYINNNKKAIEYLQKAFYMGNSDPYYLYSLIWVLLKEKKFRQAYSLIELGDSLYPNLSYFVGAKALYFANTFDIKNARKEYEKALLLTASYSPIYFYNWGVMEFQLRNFNLAENLFSEAVKFTSFAEAYLALGEISLNKADLAKAERLFMTGKPLLKSPFILYDLIYLYSIKGEKEKLLSVYKSIIKYPNRWWIYQYNLNLYEQLMNFYELENFYYKNLIKLEKKSFYNSFQQKIISNFNIIKYKILAFISSIKLRYFSALYLMTIDKNVETLNYYQVARKVVGSFPLVEKKIILKEKQVYEKVTSTSGYIYDLYYAEMVKSKSKRMKLIENFLKKADYEYERMDILSALELKARIYKRDIDVYINIIGEIYNILPNYFISSDLYIPVNVSFTGEKDSISLIKRYLRKKGFRFTKASPINIEVSCSDIFNIVITYKGQSSFFSLTKDDIIFDRIALYHNMLSVFSK